MLYLMLVFSKENSYQKGGTTPVHTIFVRGFDTSGDENKVCYMFLYAPEVRVSFDILTAINLS